MMNDYKPSLKRLALLARERPRLLAGPLHLYQEQEGLSDERLAMMLGCEPESLSRLALCERPRPAPHFREDVERIAAYIHADVLQLAMVIRAAETREALSHQPETGTIRPTLLAARDHEETEQEEFGVTPEPDTANIEQEDDTR
jgi:transcriptional regulator with XRE-family HTH domain